MRQDHGRAGTGQGTGEEAGGTTGGEAGRQTASETHGDAAGGNAGECATEETDGRTTAGEDAQPAAGTGDGGLAAATGGTAGTGGCGWRGGNCLPQGSGLRDSALVPQPVAAGREASSRRCDALRLATVLVATALLGLAPVVRLGHANLLTAPPWALAAVFLAVLQLVFATWMINVPDWASARVQMVVCAIVTTIYGMLMTKTMITPADHPLILRLGEVRHAARAWCAVMLVVMGAATWFCGWTSARWRRSLMPRRKE
jgi:hypothetical protein